MDSISVACELEEVNIRDLIDEYGNSIFRMCFLYLKDFHLAEDAVQETFIKVYKNHSSFKGDSSEKTWVIRIAINVCKNYLRGSWWKRIDESAVLESVPVKENFDDEKSELAENLILEVMKLNTKYKEVILLYYYQELKVREIAEVLLIPEATVSTRLKRAKDKLRINLEGDFFNE